MRRTVPAVGLVAVLALAALAADPPAPSTNPSPTGATKGTLPKHFKALGLDAAQLAAVEKVAAAAKAKAADLESQLKAVREQERKDVEAILTPEQLNRLHELETGEPATPPAAPAPAPSTPKDK